MIAEIVPEAYDAIGRQVSQPFSRRKSPHPTFPIGRYLSQPLSVQCRTIADLRRFLLTCNYVSDEELFGKPDYWQPPEDFEKRRKGDCEDFALWAWRQLLNMGYDARFVGGSAGRYGSGHAWVEYRQDGKWFLVEPLFCRAGYAMPRLSTLHYRPRYSVSWDGKTLRYFAHKKPSSPVRWLTLIGLLPEYMIFWSRACLGLIFHAPQIACKTLRRIASKRDAARASKS